MKRSSESTLCNFLLKALNVFQYVTFRTAYAAITALALSLIFGPLVIRKLTEFKFGQEIREKAPLLTRPNAALRRWAE